MKITPIKYGASTLCESMIFLGGDAQKRIAIDFVIYLIECDGRRILVDTGCDTMPGFDMTDFCGPAAALKSHGITPEQITDVIVTHAHHDHVESARIYTNATFYIQQNERKRCEKHLPAHAQVQEFDQSLDLTPQVRILCIGGHSAGSCVVSVRQNGREFIIAGDECYHERSLREKIPTGSSFCPEKSKDFVKKYSSPRYCVLLCHQMPSAEVLQ